MPLPSWRRRQLLEKAQAREAQAAERTAVLMGPLGDEETEPLAQNFGGPHQHRCPQCRQIWTHRRAICATPNWFVVCEKCR